MGAFDSVVFDLDGTLWDTCESCAVAWNRVLKRSGIRFRPITLDDMKGVMGLAHEECVRKIFQGVSEKDIQLLIEETRGEDNSVVGEMGGILYPGVSEGLHTLAKSYPLFIVSNCQSGYVEMFFKSSGHGALFRDFECWGNTRKSKESNLRDLIRRNQLKAPVMIGDTEGDRAAAIGNAVPFWFVRYGFGKVEEAERKFSSFPEIVNALTNG